MAEHILFRFDFVAVVSPYSAGDWIESRYDDVAGGVKVYNSSGQIFSGPSLGLDIQEVNYQVPPATYRTTDESYSFCQGTTLIYYKKNTTFPYVERVSLVNSPICAVTTPVCDIEIVTSSITPASDLQTADGEIIVSATSSGSGVKYGIGDFDYFTQGQSSGTFSNLYSGNYYVYAKDANGCSSFTVVTLGIANETYGLLYRMDYKTILGELRRVEIFEAGFSGSVTEVNGGGDPCRIIWRAENTDRTHPVIASTLEVDLFNSEAMGNFYYQDLFTQDDNKYKVIQYHHNGSSYVANWQGYIAPSLYSEPYQSLPYIVTVQCIDNLASLSSKYFLGQSGNSFTGRLSITQILARCLYNTGLNLNIRIASHIFETNQTNSTTTTPFEQTFVNMSAYIDDEGNVKTCREVLEYVLTPFAARVIQSGGYWYVVRIEEMSADFDFVEFSYDGFEITQIDTGTYSPVKNIRRGTTANSATPVDQSLVMDTVPAYGKMRINYDLGYLGGLLKYGDFNDPRYIAGIVYEGSVEGVPGSGIPIYKEGPYIEKHFSPEWTLVKNGDTGGVKVDFSFSRDEGWIASIQNGDGNSYIKHKPIPVTYTSSDYISIVLRFKISQSISARIDREPNNTAISSGPRFDRTLPGSFQTTDPPYMRVRWSAKLGDYYVLQYGGGTTDVNKGINENYISSYNEFVEIKLDRVLLPDVSEITTEDLVITVYSISPLDKTTSSLSALKSAISTTNSYIGRRAIVTDPTGFGTIYYYELKEGTEAESSPDILRPADYNGTTNTKIWSLIESYTKNSVARYYNSLDLSHIQVEFFPNGITPIGDTSPSRNQSTRRVFTINDVAIQKDLVHPYLINSKIRDEVDVNLFHGDLPDISNARYIYDNYFSLQDGTPTQLWKRNSESENLTLHRILAEQLIKWYKKPSWRLGGRLRVDGTMGTITPLDTMYTSTQEQKYYLIKSLTCYDKDKEYDVEMEEFDDNITPAGFGFTVGFTKGHNA